MTCVPKTTKAFLKNQRNPKASINKKSLFLKLVLQSEQEYKAIVVYVSKQSSLGN